MATLSYAPVSTDHQSLDQQHDALTAAGCDQVLTDKICGARDDRRRLPHCWTAPATVTP
jgi:DNA invertase Pin-like site-specific DNA recombinase